MKSLTASEREDIRAYLTIAATHIRETAHGQVYPRISDAARVLLETYATRAETLRDRLA